MEKINNKDDSNTVRDVFSSVNRNEIEVDPLNGAFMMDSDEIGEIQDLVDNSGEDMNQLDCAIENISRISDQDLITDIGMVIGMTDNTKNDSQNNPEYEEMFKTLKEEINNKSSSDSNSFWVNKEPTEGGKLRQPNIVSARNSVEDNMADISRISSKGKMSEAVDFSNLQCSMDQEKLSK
jgi:hypothetical protein